MKPSFDFDGIDLREILGSGVLAREMADIAADRGYREEGSALYITSARLIHKAYSNIQALFEAGITPAAPTKEQIEGLLLFAFEGIGRIEVLPQDDLSFWQNRSAEVIAALFYGVIRFPFNDAERMRVRRSFSAAAGAASLISLAVSEEIIPMGVGSRYIGGPLAFLDCSRT